MSDEQQQSSTSSGGSGNSLGGRRRPEEGTAVKGAPASKRQRKGPGKVLNELNASAPEYYFKGNQLNLQVTDL